MESGERTGRHDRSGLHLVVTVLALVATVYLVFQLIGFLFKLLFLVAAIALGLAALRAWRGAP